MNASIFCTPSQVAIARRVERIFNAYGELIHASLSVLDVSDRHSGEHRTTPIRDFIGCLNAARRDPRAPWFDRRFEGRHYSSGYSSGCMDSYGYECTEFQPDPALPVPLLPAVALDNRMIIMPLGARTLLRSGKLDLLGSITGDGFFWISEVDFTSEQNLREKLDRWIENALEQLRHSLHNYYRYHSVEAEPELIAETLDITTACAQRLCDELTSVDREGEFGAALSIRVLRYGIWQKIVVCLTNRGKRHVKAGHLHIAGPVTLTGPEPRISLPPGNTIRVPVHARPTERGCYPIEVNLSWRDGNKMNQFNAGIEWIDIE